ncbi:MAG: hypothetical protein ACOCYV_02720 [Planctomycetota bacterium]
MTSVLVVDDAVFMRSLIRRCLEPEGYRIQRAAPRIALQLGVADFVVRPFDETTVRALAARVVAASACERSA